MLAPFAHYQRLYNIYRTLESESKTPFNYLSCQYKADLIVWYHLAWTGETVRRESKLVQYLMEKGSQFTTQDRLDLFNLICELINGLIPRYKKLQDSGQIEISSTPHFHPILPLLLEFKSSRDALPFAPLPHCTQYPGGRERAEAHIVKAQQSHQKRFGKLPTGMWPAEGGVSHAGLSLMAEHGVKWAATGEGVLANSLYKSFVWSELRRGMSIYTNLIVLPMARMKSYVSSAMMASRTRLVLNMRKRIRMMRSGTSSIL